MTNGILKPPNLDDRTWQDLVDETIALIPQYNPQWRDHSHSDLGITLIELFAWMTEQIIYRLNRVPEKNYVEFLNFVGITREPPTPARAEITCRLAVDTPVIIPKGTQFATTATGSEAGVIFETRQDFDVTNLKACLLLREDDQDPQCPLVYQDFSTVLLPGFEEEHREMEIKIPSNSKRMLVFGVSNTTLRPFLVYFKISERRTPLETFAWKYSADGQNNWTDFNPQPDYAFHRSDSLQFQMKTVQWQAQSPGDWNACPEAGENEITDSLYWIGVEIENGNDADLIINIKRIAANIVPAANALTVRDEILGSSNGNPFQIYKVRNIPIYKDPNNELHLILKINEDGIWKEWHRVEELSGGNEQYLCNPVTGEITFGNYPTNNPNHPGQGRIPDEGAQIKVESYRYSAGGSNGNVPARSIEIQRSPIPGVVAVINEEPATGGTNEEDPDETKKRAPNLIKSRDRAVTAEEYEFFAREASLEVAGVRCLPPKKVAEGENGEIIWDLDPLDRSLGRINMILLPSDNVSRRPRPAEALRRQVASYLAERKTVGGLLIFDERAPFYVEVTVTATIYVKAGKDTLEQLDKIHQAFNIFFHPVSGGPQGKGWRIGQSLYIPTVFDLLDGLEDVSYVEDLQIAGIDYSEQPVSAKGLQIPVKEHELICAASTENYSITLKEETFGLNFGA